MAITQRGSATNATNANVIASGTLACNKPTGVASGDVLVAIVTTNDDTSLGGPSGWTKQIDQVAGVAGTDHFEVTVWTKVAGGAEGSTYTWTKSAGATASPMVITITAWQGVDNTTPVLATTKVGFNTNQTEPMTTTTTPVTNTLNLPLYFRAVRFATSSNVVPTFTASANELDDVGIWSGGTIAYSHAVYSNSNDQTFGQPDTLDITVNQTESHTVEAMLVLNDDSQEAQVVTVFKQAMYRSNRW